MAFGGESGGMTKFDYARHAAAALAYLVTQQQDAVGLMTFDQTSRRSVPPAASAGHLRALIHELESAEPGGLTGVGSAIGHAGEQIGRRAVVVIFSDLLDSTDSILEAIRRLRHNNHEVVLFHILDHEERTFPFERMTRFEGLEAMPQVMADPAALRTAYLKELDAFTRTMRHGCLGSRADFVELDTRTTLDVALSSYLASRERRK